MGGPYAARLIRLNYLAPVIVAAILDGNEPTGHLLSSQISCLNHLYAIRQRPDLANAVLRAIDAEVVEAEVVDDGYVEFEFIGEHSYLGESPFFRGKYCTSIDALMIGQILVVGGENARLDGASRL